LLTAKMSFEGSFSPPPMSRGASNPSYYGGGVEELLESGNSFATQFLEGLESSPNKIPHSRFLTTSSPSRSNRRPASPTSGRNVSSSSRRRRRSEVSEYYNISKSGKDDGNPSLTLTIETDSQMKEHDESGGVSQVDTAPCVIWSIEAFIEEDDAAEEINRNWELQLGQLVDKLQMTTGLEEPVRQQLIALPVKEFNVRVKSMKLDSRTLQHLKLCRKRDKNRKAAEKSREKIKEATKELLQEIESLRKENGEQRALIARLQRRVNELEKEREKEKEAENQMDEEPEKSKAKDKGKEKGRKNKY